MTVDIFCKDLALQYGIERNYFRDLLGLMEINHPMAQNGKDYLAKRMQYQYKRFMYEPKNPSIIILNMCDDRVIGFQLRSLNPQTPNDRRFLTFNIERIYKHILKSNVVIPEELTTVSTLFNIYDVDIYNPIIVVEGPMDSFLLPNAIATTGATKKLNLELPFWYMFDADDTGNKYAIQKLKQGEKVFLWSKFKTFYKLPNRSKWDVNDVVLYLSAQGVNRIEWLNFFSDSQLDMWMIDSLGMRL